VGGIWYYRVKASNFAGDSDWSNIESTSVRPAKPNLYLIDNSDGDGNYTVDWLDVTGAMTYVLQEADTINFTNPITRYIGSTSQFTVSEQAGGIWHYRVRASNIGGDSDWSNIESVGVRPATPTLSEIANSDGDGDYIVNWPEVTSTISYTLEEDDNNSFTHPTTYYITNSSQYAISNHVTGIWYYRLKASNEVGDSDWSNIESTSVKPKAPILNTITNADNSSNYILNWSAVTGALSYTLQEANNTDFTTPTLRYTGQVTTFEIHDQPIGTWYYRVGASNIAGDSDWSNVESTVVMNVAGDLFTASPYVPVEYDGYFLAELQSEGASVPGLAGIHLRAGNLEIPFYDDGAHNDLEAEDSIYGASVPFTQTGIFQVTLLHGSRELDNLEITVIEDPALVVITDWPALYAEFRDTGMGAQEDENNNQRHDFMELVDWLYSYNRQQRGVLISLPDAITQAAGYPVDYAGLDYRQDTETRLQMGHLVDQVIANLNTQTYDSIQNIVVLGDDEVVPFYRVYDPTDFYNEFTQDWRDPRRSREIDYPDSVGGTQENATLLDSRAAYIMSDVPYSVRAHQVITRGTWLSMLPNLPHWASYPLPDMGIGRVFAARPGQLLTALKRYDKPLFMTADHARAALFLADDGELGVNDGVEFPTLVQRSLYPQIEEWFGDNLTVYDALATPWLSDHLITATNQSNLVSLWGHSAHDVFEINSTRNIGFTEKRFSHH
jgi:hypothetical protein